MDQTTSRRGVLLAGLGAAAAWAGGARAAARSVSFQIWRQGAQIGAHDVTLTRDGDQTVAVIAATLQVKVGPITVFTHRHDATETWAGDRFVSLRARSVSNGRVETVDARASDRGVTIVRNRGATLNAPAGAAPLSHWNREALMRPLFNPQTGALVHCGVIRRGLETVHYANGASAQATGFTLTGDADMIDWYDEGGAWAALHAKGPDGSLIDYRRT